MHVMKYTKFVLRVAGIYFILSENMAKQIEVYVHNILSWYLKSCCLL